MKTIWKRVALLAMIFLLGVIAFVFTNLVLTREPAAHLQLAYAAGPPLAAQVVSKPFVTGVYRIGINTGPQDSVGPGAFMANMFDNPGFEPTSESHLIIIGGGRD